MSGFWLTDIDNPVPEFVSLDKLDKLIELNYNFAFDGWNELLEYAE